MLFPPKTSSGSGCMLHQGSGCKALTVEQRIPSDGQVVQHCCTSKIWAAIDDAAPCNRGGCIARSSANPRRRAPLMCSFHSSCSWGDSVSHLSRCCAGTNPIGAALRMRFGGTESSGSICFPHLAANAHVPCAAPCYLQRLAKLLQRF